MKKAIVLTTVGLSFATFCFTSCSNPDGTDSFKESMRSKPEKIRPESKPADGDTTQDYETNYPHDTIHQ